MFGVIVRLLKNKDALTTAEYGMIAVLMLIAVERMATRL
jgi:hypothetical protein